MMRLALFLTVVLVGAVTVACEDTAETPLPTQDRDRIEQTVRDYFSAIQQDGTPDRLRQLVRSGVRDADLDRARDQIREHQYQIEEITEIRRDGDRATATLRLRDHDGSTLTRKLELERDQDQWRIRDPDLKR